MPLQPPSITSYTSTPISLRSGSTIHSSCLNSDGDTCYNLSSSYLSSMWAKSGTLKTSFGDNGFVDTKSKYTTCMQAWSDSYGSGSILTGGGYDLMGR